MNRPSPLKRLLPAALALAAAAVNARADLMVSNLGSFNPNQITYAAEDQWVASPFVTDGSAISFNLDGVILSMDEADDDAGNFFVAIYDDLSGVPGSELAVLSGESNPAELGEYFYDGGGLSLLPNTTYWVVAGVSSGSGVYYWGFINSETTDVWTIPNQVALYVPGDEEGWVGPYFGAQVFSVSATAVPEPSTLGLTGMALGAACFPFRRRRRKA